tara:strand:+ start:1286 stop:1939 length:654 start_codon:yes stop_codon:yes gene_type:complete
MKKILAIGAHPDDIEFGCGGTLLKHKRKGDFVIYLCMTGTQSIDGTTGKVIRSLDQLTKEIDNATKLLKCDKVIFLPFTDLKVPFSFESVSEIEKIIKLYNIDTVYTHWAGDANQDHIATFKASMAACRYVPNVYCYEQIPIPRMSENQMDINYYVDVTNVFDQKLKVSACHESQINKYGKIGFNIIENLKTLANFRGIQARCKYAEGFNIIKKVEN